MIALKIDGKWTAIKGVRQFEQTVTTRVVTYHDGRRVEESCDPYQVTVQMDVQKVESLFRDGIWTQENLDQFGLKVVGPLDVPDGFAGVGARIIVEQEDGTLKEIHESVRMLPPQVEQTVEERIAERLGITGDQLKEFLAQK